MKSTISMILIVVVTSISSAQEKQTPNFNHIDLKDLRKELVSELIRDGLIVNKKADIQISLRTNKTELNGKELNEKLHLKYGKIADQFGIGRGSYRTVLINGRCTAVGDFFEDSFRGKMEGRMRIAAARSSEI